MDLEIVKIIKQMSTFKGELNMKTYSGLLALVNKDRMDIVKNIKKLINSDPYKYTPELFAEWLKNPDDLIKRYDKLYNKKAIKHEYRELEYEEKKMAYSLGESDENPDA